MDYKNIFENMKVGILPPKETVLALYEEVSEILILENNVLDLKGSFKVVGDIHGQYYDFLKIFEKYGNLQSLISIFSQGIMLIEDLIQ